MKKVFLPLIAVAIAALISVSAWQWQTSTGQAIIVESSSVIEEPILSPEEEKEYLACLRAETERIRANSYEVHASGEVTAGSVVTINGKGIQLPKDVYIAHKIVSAVCMTNPCKTPVTILARLGQPEMGIAINVDGTIWEDPRKTAEDSARIRSDFSWLIEAIGIELQ